MPQSNAKKRLADGYGRAAGMKPICNLVFGMAMGAAVLAASAQAQTPAPDSPEAIALEITTLQMSQINLDQITMIALQQVAQAKRMTDPKQLADLQAIGPVIKEEISGLMPNMAKMVSSFFSESFTEPELRELLAFYSSPTGRKFNARSQEFGARMGVAMQLALQERAPAITRRVQEEMLKKGHKL